jgi:hypothetical protein
VDGGTGSFVVEVAGVLGGAAAGGFLEIFGGESGIYWGGSGSWRWGFKGFADRLGLLLGLGFWRRELFVDLMVVYPVTSVLLLSVFS